MPHSLAPEAREAIVAGFISSTVPSCVVDHDARLLAANKAASRFLAAEVGFTLRDGALAAKDPKSNKNLKAALAGRRRRLLFVRDGQHAAKNIFALVAPKASPTASFVMFWRESALRLSLIAPFAEHYALSSQQARVAAEIAAGRNIDRIARKMGITSDTVRSHLKAVFEKTGIHTQSGLAALAARYGGFLP